MASYTKTYETNQQRKLLIEIAERQSHRLMQDNHQFYPDEKIPSEQGAFKHGELVFEDAPDNTPGSIVDPFASYKAEYAALTTTSQRLDFLAKMVNAK